MKFLVPNYGFLQNPWRGGYRPQIPVLSVLCPQLNLLNLARTKFLGTPPVRNHHNSLRNNAEQGSSGDNLLNELDTQSGAYSRAGRCKVRNGFLPLPTREPQSPSCAASSQVTIPTANRHSVYFKKMKPPNQTAAPFAQSTRAVCLYKM